MVPGTSLACSQLHSRQIVCPSPESLQHFTGDAAGLPLKFLEVLDIFLLSGLGEVEMGEFLPLGPALPSDLFFLSTLLATLAAYLPASGTLHRWFLLPACPSVPVLAHRRVPPL